MTTTDHTLSQDDRNAVLAELNRSVIAGHFETAIDCQQVLYGPPGARRDGAKQRVEYILGHRLGADSSEGVQS